MCCLLKMRCKALSRAHLRAQMILQRLQAFWCWVRELSGDDAYERYLRHHAEHPQQKCPLTRHQFIKARINNQWNGIKRCC